LPADDVTRLADATAGMIEPQIREVAAKHQPGDELPTPPKYSWSRNPVTGEYCERQLNPYELADQIDAAGFRSTVRHAFRQFPLRPLNGVQIRPLNVKLFSKRSVFVIVSEAGLIRGSRLPQTLRARLHRGGAPCSGPVRVFGNPW
jgi:hypothetical protein